jgi:hypothetical protein
MYCVAQSLGLVSDQELLDTRVKLSKWDVDTPANQSTVSEHPLHVRAGCSSTQFCNHCHVSKRQKVMRVMYCMQRGSEQALSQSGMHAASRRVSQSGRVDGSRQMQPMQCRPRVQDSGVIYGLSFACARPISDNTSSLTTALQSRPLP